MNATLHWFPADVSAARLATVMAGMANTSGGTIIIGATPRSGHVHGVTNPELIVDIVFQAALLVDPALVLPVPQVITVGAAKVMLVIVPSGLPHLYSVDGRFLGREGVQTNPIPARRLRQLLLERGVVQFETQTPPDARLEDLNPEKMAAYAQALSLPGSSAPEEILLRRGCLRWEGGSDRRNLIPTYAALLLFGVHPQQWLPNAAILAARFSGKTMTEQFIKQEIRGTLPEQIRQALAFVAENQRTVVRLDGLTHRESPEYPLEALRELLVNAVAHRDYNLQGDNIHLFMFSDRIEIQSPGGLPGPMNLKNLFETRFSRNAVIMQVLADLGFVERLGYGLNRVEAVLRTNGLPPAVYEELGASFRVTIYGQEDVLQAPHIPELQLPSTQLELNPRQELALRHLAAHRRITNRQYQDLCPEVSAETLRRDLADLVGRSLLVKIGDKRATYYILKR